MKITVISVICAIIGVAAGYLATPSSESGGEASEQTAREGVHAVDDLSSGHETTPPGSTATDDAAVPGTPVIPVEKVSILPDHIVQSLIAEVRANLTVGGDGEVRGKVADRFGRPIEGALVCVGMPEPFVLDRWPLSIADGRPVETPLVDVLRVTIREHAFTRLLRREATTDASGEFAIGGLPEERTLHVSIFKDGYDFVSGWSRMPLGCEAGALLYVVGNPLTSVPISVVDEKDVEVEGAWIHAASSNGQSLPRFWWTPAARIVPLQEGSMQVSAALGDDDGGRSEAVTVEVPLRDDVKVPVKLLVKKSSRVEVTVAYPEGERPTGLPLKLVPQKGASVTDDEIRNGDQTLWIDTFQRKCRFESVLPGTYVVAVIRDDDVVAKKSIDVGEGTTKVDLELPAAKASDYVVVRVLDPSGDILRDVNVYDSEGGGNVLWRTDGSFWVARRPAWFDGKPEPNAESRMTASSAQYGTKSVKYSPASSAEVTIKFDAPANLVVTIEDYVGSIFDGRIQLVVNAETKERDAENQESTFRTDSGREISTADEKARGVFRFRSLQTGPHVAVVSMTNLRGDTNSLMQQSFAVKPGENDVRIKLPSVHALVVQTVGLKTGTYINLNRQVTLHAQDDVDGQWQNGAVNENGQVTFEHLLAGTYALSTWTPSGEAGTVFVDVPRQTTVRYDARPANGLLIPANAEPKLLENLGFVSGDIIVGYDGEEWERSPSQAIDGIDTEKPTVSVRVIRGGSPMEISVDPKKFNEARGEVWLMPVVR